LNSTVFYEISKIIERDNKSTTYKFALLRGVIDIIQDNSPYIALVGDRVQVPVGLLVEKWLLYYYPILQSRLLIPQINGPINLAFENEMRRLIASYEDRGGFSVFYNDLKNKGIPKDLLSNFSELSKKLRDTIIRMPMKYIGRSFNYKYYSIFQYDTSRLRTPAVMDLDGMIRSFGTFSIPVDYYEAFKVLGSFISGRDSILIKWAEFSVNASTNNLSVDKVLCEVLKSPITARNVAESKKLYGEILKRQGKIFCVWTGRHLSSYDIDHLIPFSVWKNNDLWNLLPSDSRINNMKRDKIPSPEIIERQKQLILDYWSVIYKYQSERFEREIQVALLGHNPFESWKNVSIAQIQRNCNYLIESRGFESWKI
jgi:hypothetical protein